MYEAANAIGRVGRIATQFVTEVHSKEFDAFEPEPDIDEEEIFNIVRRYVNKLDSAPFSIAESRAYLRNLGVELPENAREFGNLFENWREDIAAIKEQQGEKVRWVEFKQGR